MPSKKISEFPEELSPVNTDVIPIVGGGANKKVTISTMANQVAVTMQTYTDNRLLDYYTKAEVDGGFLPLSQLNTISDQVSSSVVASINAQLLTYATQTYVNSNFINVTEYTTIYQTASATAKNYTDNQLLNYITVNYLNSTVYPTASATARNYVNANFVPLSSLNTIYQTASTTAANYTNTNFVPLSNLNTIYQTTSTTAATYVQNYTNDVHTLVRSNSAIWAEPIRRFEYLENISTQVNPVTSYSGSALPGTALSSSGWTIRRIIYTNVGSVFNTGIAQNAIWDNRTSTIYV